MEKNLISIIVAVYNVEKYLNKCIKSIVNQTYHNLEIILVDDGSKDNSGKICDEWAGKDSRIHVIHKQNGGVSDARNYGLKASNGEWICFVDGDDYISLNMYETLYKNRSKQGITVCGYYVVENGKEIPVPGINKKLAPKEAANLYLTNERQSVLNSNFTYFGSYPWNKLYDRSVFQGVEYPEHKKFEDMYIMLELLHQSYEIRFIPDCKYYYIQRRGSITHQKSIQVDSLDARLKQKKELEEFWDIKDKKIDELIALSYIAILRKYAINPYSERIKYTSLKKRMWASLNSIGYDDFPLKIKLKLLLMHIPDLYYVLYSLKEKLNSGS
ncbi:glycosyl transferase family 2 [Acidaminococcus fermentans DSM 20731]|uniref:Glycosyl transferase family 2 n=2 Tax=Acidaminococcus fermentans TaxID=905 RepID=D2RJ85_ACIFV|nr:glycosyltransferase [Acidaminococcus fermentans]ADB47137.1 glycosyl transferase family 2 [Acidaminococcus fermentans DSM 20731]